MTTKKIEELTFICRPCARQSYEFCDGGMCGYSATFIFEWKEALELLTRHEDLNSLYVKELAEALLEETATWTI